MGRNLDDTLHYAEGKVPKVVNEPSSDDPNWSWDWNKNADEIIAELGWRGLAQACAWYDPDASDDKEDGKYPKVKSAYKLPHHKLIDGKLTLVWGGVRAAMQRLKSTEGIDREAVYRHLAAHYRHFGKEPPPLNDDADLEEKKAELEDKKQALVDVVKKLYDKQVAELTDDEKYEIVLSFLEYQVVDIYMYVLNALDANASATDFMSGLKEVLNSFAEKVGEVYSKFYSEGGIQTMEEDRKDVDVTALEQRIADLEAENKDLKAKVEEYEAKIAELEGIKAEYEEFKAAVEAEREEARKNELARTRLAELEEAGVKFSDERREKVFARLREMSDEEFADYKADLLEVAAVKAEQAKAAKEEDVDVDVADEPKVHPFARQFARLNVEQAPEDLVKKYMMLDE